MRKKQKKSKKFAGINRKSFTKLIFPLVLVSILFFTIFSISNNYFSNLVDDLRAAVGYGCGEYGTSSDYGGDCPDPLTQSDLPTLNTLVGGITCTPDPVDATNTTTCSGTLPTNFTPPTGTLSMQVEGENSSICSFTGNTFSCSGMTAASVFGPSVNIQASIDTNPFVNTGKIITVNQINFTQADISNLESISGGITCTPDPAEVNPQTTSCSFSLPGYYNNITNTFLLRLEPEASVICNNISNNFSCNNLTTGTTTGLKDIQAALDANPFEDTGKQVQVNLIELKQTDLNNLNTISGGITCTPDPVISTQTTTCSGTLASNYTPPTSNLNLQVAGQSSQVCTFIGNTFTCSNLPSGTTIGPRDILASIGTNPFVNTGKQITVNPIELSQSDISNLDTLVNGITCTPDPVTVTNSTSCSGTLPVNYQPPSGTLNLRLSGESSNSCTFSSNTFTCSNLDTGNTIGIRQVQGSIGINPFVNTGKQVTTDPIILSQSDLVGLNTLVGGIDCTPSTVIVEQTTTCTGSLPQTYTAPTGTLRLNVASQPDIDCSFIGQQFTCSNLPVGSNIGIRNIQASINSGSAVNTGKQIQVNPITLNNTNIQSLNDIVGGIICTPEITEVNSSITCSGTLPNNYVPPTQPMSLSVEGTTPVSCTFTSNTFSCPNIPTGSNFGVRNIQVNLGSDSPVNTGKIIIIQTAGGGSIFVSETDIINIGTGSINDPFETLDCGTAGNVSGGSLTGCSGILKTNFLLPLDFFLGIGTEPAGECIQTNQSVSCVDIPVINKEGVSILLVRVNDSGSLNTNRIFTVQGLNAELPEGGAPVTEDPTTTDDPTIIDAVEDLSRTGSGLTIILIATGLFSIVVFITVPYFKKKAKVKLK